MIERKITWHSVKEKLPNDCDCVLITTKNPVSFHVESAVYYATSDQDYQAGFYVGVDKDGKEIPATFEVGYWAIIDFLPFD